MSRRRSSIFSFDTLAQFQWPPRDAFVALVVALGVFVSAELAARAALKPVGRYWEYWSPAAATKFEWFRRQAESGNPYDIVIVGDSTAANNLDPASIRNAVAGAPTVYNLGWPANFPLAFEESTVPLFDRLPGPPALLLVSFNPQGFVTTPNVLRFEAGIRSSALCKRIETGWVMGDILNLARVRSALPLWKDRWLREISWDAPPKDEGFIPHGGKNAVHSDATADSTGDQPPLPLESARFEAILKMARVAKANGIELVVLVPPRREVSAAHEKLVDEYVDRLKDASPDMGFRMIDGRNSGLVAADDFSDAVHLNVAGARRFSQAIGARLRRTEEIKAADSRDPLNAATDSSRNVTPDEGD
jgi:hypothetical protein